MDDLFTVGDFPYHVAPFPDTSDLLYTHPTPSFHHSDVTDHRRLPNPPPQKLRPIRSLDRSSSPPSLLVEIPENGGLAGTSHDVGYPCQQPSQNLVLLDRQVESCEELRKEASDDGAGNDCLQTDTPAGLGPSHSCELKQESGSSWEDDGDDDSSESVEDRGYGKKRKKTIAKFEAFLENLVTKVMEKQEKMHQQLLDMIENKERERAVREEAWKQKEMVRIKKDEEARAQEKYNNLALISLIQNLLGHEIQIPQPAATSARDDDEGEGEANVPKDFKSDQSNNRWPEAEVQALVTLRTCSEHKFQGIGSKVSVWEEISKAMNNMGYNRSAKKCKEKWENINKYYKRTMESRKKKRRLNNKACPYFDELDILYRNRLPHIGNAFSDTSMSSKTEK
ncbi:trihelix transcription factor DF1 [Prosopis cineraria]|uniref:trihelix transcription factor DF1 n=1 Tax=Prosopis cineraria TaxID=364024 RepID=UPI00240FF47B|nr:trihelix transcription factor DF1 [Prosopis cineraria]